MIERYATKELEELFSLKHRFETFLQIEKAVVNAYVKLNVIPLSDAEKINKNASFNLDRVLELESQTHHDVVAFTRAVSETLGEEKKWIHYTLTSTDVVDTSMSVIYHEANEIILKSLDELISLVKEKALMYKDTPMIGRTHGIHGEVTSFGLKWALYYDMLMKNRARFLDARMALEQVKLSGAVGNFANIPSFIQDDVAKTLSLNSARIATQVLARDDHAYYISVLNLITSTIEQMATEIRLLSQTEINEVEEGFAKNQKGSSAMPHKKNPIASENIVGCARMNRGYMQAIYEDIALWHERDISHSSVERVVFADSISLTNYMLKRMSKVLKNLKVNEEKMRKNIYLTHGIIFSQRVLSSLIEKGTSREEAYDKIQALCLFALNNGVGFYELLTKDEFILRYLNEEEIQACFDVNYYLKSVDEIYHRVNLL